MAVSPQKMRQVVVASSAGTIFEWYDFFVYGSLVSIMAEKFFANLSDDLALIFSLLTFSIGLIARPVGALVFGKIGDSQGRKGAFLITISIMGLATFAIGLLPTAAQIGMLAPVLLIALRVLQGFALGGEYGGAAIYVAEHAAHGRRGAATAWIQVAASIGLVGALGVILTTRTLMGEEAFRDWGWRIPFLVSIGLLGISIWIRLQLEESPAFKKLKEEGQTSKSAYAESFLHWDNLKIVLLALFGLMMAQGVSWYATHFYAPVFLERTLKVEQRTVNELMMTVVLLSAPFYVFFAWLSDKVGRKPIMLFGMVLFVIASFPGYHLLQRAANPALETAMARAPVTILADPADCSFQLDLTGGAGKFQTGCDIARAAVTGAGVNYTTEDAAPGAPARIRIGDTIFVGSASAEGATLAETGAVRADVAQRLRAALSTAGYPAQGEAGPFNFWLALGVLFVFVIAATALYGPQAAALVELFPTRIRYTAMSLPYNVGTGWFGGLLPPTVFAISTTTGDIYSGLWFPVIVTAIAAVICLLFWPETKDRDIHA
ncbi:MAG: MFS transporter [Alphaproteobacteria bacterium]|nr:MFS transporter [Alphaproteobacteria bacterium]